MSRLRPVLTPSLQAAILPTHKAPARRPDGVNLFALPNGGFLARDPQWREMMDYGRGEHAHYQGVVAFSTLDELLEWLRIHMRRPAEEPSTR